MQFGPRMKSFILVLFLVSSGCFQTRSLTPGSARLRADINGRASEQTVFVMLSWGEVVRAQSFHLAPDVATWLDLEDGTLRSVPASDVVRVQFLNRGRGALEGAGWGLVATGAVAAAAGMYSIVSGDTYFGPAGDAVIMGVITGPSLVLLGTMGGAIMGSTTSFDAPLGEGLFGQRTVQDASMVRAVTPSLVRTDASSYVAEKTTAAVARRERRYSGRYAFTVVAEYMNATPDTVYLARAAPTDAPAFTVRTISSELGAEAGSAYRSAMSGVDRSRPLAVAPGETRTDTLQVEGLRRDLRTGTVRGLMQGQMALVYIASQSRDPWRVLPDSAVVSNPFEVRLE